MMLVSYAQHGEDIVLDALFPGEDAGFYVDIGANDPSFCSVTRYFYERGWSGINVEPVPSLCAKLRRARPRDVNLHAGLSDREGALTFFESPAVTGWSTFCPDLAAGYSRRGLVMTERVVPVLTLTGLFERYVSRPVDFLKIDVEGHEARVVRGIDWGTCRPRALVIESAGPEAWAHLIPPSDYHLLYRDRINSYYVRRGDPRFERFLGLGGSLPSVRSFVRPKPGGRFETTLARLASRDDLGPAGRAVRRALFRSLHAASSWRGWRRDAG
jgi:FkbM family methyltransferase